MKNSINKEPIKILPYEEVQFRFVSSHYDIHIAGSCIHDNQLCMFTTEYPGWNDEKDSWEEPITKIYKLNWAEKLKWIWIQWSFEQCVGYHWSYNNSKRCNGFYYRKPKWFYKLLYKIYYKTTKQ